MANLNRAIELNPNEFLAYYNRGAEYGNMGETDNGIADSTKAIELKPKFAEAYYGRGVLHRRNGDNSKADKDFAKAKEFGLLGRPAPHFLVSERYSELFWDGFDPSQDRNGAAVHPQR